MKEKKFNNLLYCILGISIFLTLLFHIYLAITDQFYYRAMHLGAVLDWANNGIISINPIIPGFNLNNTPTPQEIPVWHLFSLLGYIISKYHSVGLVSVNLLFFLGTVIPVYLISKRFLDNQISLLATISFTLQPLVFKYAGLVSPDFVAIFFQLWFVWAVLKLNDKFNITFFILAIVFGAATATMKLPFFMVAGLFLFFLIEKKKDKLIRLILIGTICSILFFLWSNYTDSIQKIAEFPHIQLSITENPNMIKWYFGTIEQRLDINFYIRAFWRAGNGLFGSYVLVVCVFIFINNSKIRFAYYWILSGIFTTFVFFNIILEHSHYYLMVSYPIAVIIGYSISSVISFTRKKKTIVTLIFFGLLMSLIQGFYPVKNRMNVDFYKPVSTKVQVHLKKNEKLAVVNGGWGGDFFVISNIRGVTANEYYMDKNYIKKLISKGFQKILFISDDYMLPAILTYHSGKSLNIRKLAIDFLSNKQLTCSPISNNIDFILLDLNCWLDTLNVSKK